MVEGWWICCSFCKLSSWCPSSMFLFHSPSSVLPSTLTHIHTYVCIYIYLSLHLTYTPISRFCWPCHKRNSSLEVWNQHACSGCSISFIIEYSHSMISFNQKINTLFLFSPFLPNGDSYTNSYFWEASKEDPDKLSRTDCRLFHHSLRTYFSRFG